MNQLRVIESENRLNIFLQIIVWEETVYESRQTLALKTTML